MSACRAQPKHRSCCETSTRRVATGVLGGGVRKHAAREPDGILCTRAQKYQIVYGIEVEVEEGGRVDVVVVGGNVVVVVLVEVVVVDVLVVVVDDVVVVA